MPDVSAVSLSPTWAVPLMLGAPVAGLFSGCGSSCCSSSSATGPATVSSVRLDSILPSSAQTAPWLSQSFVTGSATVTSLSPLGSTVISQRTLLPLSSRRACVTRPPVTSRTWFRSFDLVADGDNRNLMS